MPKLLLALVLGLSSAYVGTSWAVEPPRLQWWDGTRWVEVLWPVLTTTTVAPTTTSTSTTASTAPVPVPTTTSTGWIAPTTSTTLVTSGIAYYAAPNGNSGNTGLSPASPLTFAQAIPKLRPGDTLWLLEGIYPMSRVVCGNAQPEQNNGVCNGIGANAKCGTAALPITLRAINERRANFAANGTDPGFEMHGCTYWNIVGLRASTQDNPSNTEANNHTFSILDSSRLVLTRNLVWRNNRCGNNSAFSLTGCVRCTITENEVWESSRHGISFHGGNAYNVVARNYINNNGRGPSSATNCPWKGSKDSNCITAYPTQHTVFANNICEGGGSGGNFGYTNQSGGGAYDGQQASSFNRWVGNVAAGTFMGMKVLSRPQDSRGVKDVTILDYLAIDPYGFGLRHSVAKNTILKNFTILRGSGAAQALGIDNPAYDSNAQLTCSQIGGCSITAENGLAIEGDGRVSMSGPYSPCTIATTTAKSFSVGTCGGSGRSSIPMPTTVGNTGTKCPFFCGDGDPACDGTGTSGADRGADLRCLYDDTGVKRAGAANSLVTPQGDFAFCGAEIAGVNDGSISNGKTCKTFPTRYFNLKKDGTGCPLSATACPQ